VSDLRAPPAPTVDAIHRALARGVDEGAFPGGAAAVFFGGRLAHLSSAGRARVVPASIEMQVGARFDLASLTKVLATTSAIAVLAARGALALDDAASRLWPPFARAGKGAVTLRELLAHASGLPAWRPFFLEAKAHPAAAPLFADPLPAREACESAARHGAAVVLERLCEEPLEWPPGERTLYSDLGFMALGRAVEEAAGEALDLFTAREVFGALRLPSLGFCRVGAPLSSALYPSTGLFRPREPALGQEALVPAPGAEAGAKPRPGEVDDDNAFAMGGVAGHAGLFGDAHDVAAFGNAVLEELDGAGRLAPAPLWETLVAPFAPAGGGRALGFDLPSPHGAAAGAHLARSRTLGHNGFTGTSLWIDRHRRLSVALLTNRVHPRRGNEAIRAFRPVFHDAVVEALGLERI
jgi:CubicO group peptidase (beta-lactamase class C family)